MNIIYEAGGYNSPQLLEVLRSGACWRTVKEALRALEIPLEFAFKFAAKVVCGTYILHSKEKDMTYSVAEQAAKADEPKIETVDRLAMIRVLSSENEMTIRSRVEQLYADESTEFPPIYDAELHVADVYTKFVDALDLELSPGDYLSARPLRLLGNCEEEEALSKLKCKNDGMARKLLPFITFERDDTVGGSWTFVDHSVVVGGGRLDEDQFVLDRQQLPAPFSEWRSARRGTIGIILTMNHPQLGRHTYGLTSAHVVFRELLDADDNVRNQFNAVVAFAHYDVSRTLDFCMLELRPTVTQVHNTVHSRLSPTLLDVAATESAQGYRGMKVLKVGARSFLTSGDLISVNRIKNGVQGMVVVGSAKQFSMPGDSGSMYLLYRQESDTFIPIALHKGVYESGNATQSSSRPAATARFHHLHVGCNLISCLKKFVQKMTNSNAAVDTMDIVAWFRVAQNTV